jgi:hypothetical protein
MAVLFIWFSLSKDLRTDCEVSDSTSDAGRRDSILKRRVGGGTVFSKAKTFGVLHEREQDREAVFSKATKRVAHSTVQQIMGVTAHTWIRGVDSQNLNV